MLLVLIQEEPFDCSFPDWNIATSTENLRLHFSSSSRGTLPDLPRPHVASFLGQTEDSDNEEDTSDREDASNFQGHTTEDTDCLGGLKSDRLDSFTRWLVRNCSLCTNLRPGLKVCED
jgi:hypothetical protein